MRNINKNPSNLKKKCKKWPKMSKKWAKILQEHFFQKLLAIGSVQTIQGTVFKQISYKAKHWSKKAKN